jgi:uncharacterized protein YegL
MNVEIACVIDRSGSMSAIRNDAIGGFNTFLAEQKAVPGEAKLTLVLFDHEYFVLHDAVDIQNVPALKTEDFVPRGTTALFDAVGRTIDSIGARLDKAATKPDKVIVVILTDGVENASHDYERSRIAEMIKHQQEKYSWEFVFLAANQDAFKAADALNIKSSNTAGFTASSVGTRSAYTLASNMTKGYR